MKCEGPATRPRYYDSVTGRFISEDLSDSMGESTFTHM